MVSELTRYSSPIRNPELLWTVSGESLEPLAATPEEGLDVCPEASCQLPSGSSYQGQAVDVDGDGDPDFVGRSTFYLNDGNGVFERVPGAPYSTGLPFDVPDGHAAFEPTRRDAKEGHAVAVLPVHVGRDLVDEAGEELGVRRDLAVERGEWLWLGAQIDEALEDGLDAEVGERTGEEHRR